ncbi:hypothetical protein [Yersinia ruckeri]|uniref:hypothetical protein n=1 Tax=Yersinia ruckeri TaxID=29486 RepID=UPI0022388DF3|nr:hypothetical protein [Yersinia ruckeri]MCW6598846.1 hypothetical protein [Yersinia ruckeri]
MNTNVVVTDQNLTQIQSLVQIICKNLKLKLAPLKQGEAPVYFDAQGEKHWAEEKVIGVTVNPDAQMVEIFDLLIKKVELQAEIATNVFARSPIVTPAGEGKVFVQVNMAFYNPDMLKVAAKESTEFPANVNVAGNSVMVNE